MKIKPALFLLTLLVLAGNVDRNTYAADVGPYITQGTCDGFPKVNLKTAPGLCVGIVASQLGFARGVTTIGSNIYVTDSGGWGSKGKGRLLKISNNGHDKPEVILDHLDQPHSVVPAPGKTLYISTTGKIIQFDPANHTTKEIVINLPVDGKHALSAFTVAPDGSLFINIGAATDHCERGDGSAPDPKKPCPETVKTPPRGSILHVKLQQDLVDASTIKPYATGLRNSMALATSTAGQLYAAVNARDSINLANPSLSDEELPHDTFDKVLEGQDYGWPYCYDNNLTSPEYQPYDCSRKQAPTFLLPAHAAPLSMIFYRGSFLSGLKDKLVMGYHGYRATGHRIVTLVLNEKGVPESAPVEIVNDWGAKPGNHPQGAPVTLFEADDGSIFITEDQNGTLLRLSK